MKPEPESLRHQIKLQQIILPSDVLQSPPSSVAHHRRQQTLSTTDLHLPLLISPLNSLQKSSKTHRHSEVEFFRSFLNDFVNTLYIEDSRTLSSILRILWLRSTGFLFDVDGGDSDEVLVGRTTNVDDCGETDGVYDD